MQYVVLGSDGQLFEVKRQYELRVEPWEPEDRELEGDFIISDDDEVSLKVIVLDIDLQ